MFSKLALALLGQLFTLVAWAGPTLAEPVQFASALVPPTPFMQRQAELRGTVVQPVPRELIAVICAFESSDLEAVVFSRKLGGFTRSHDAGPAVNLASVRIPGSG